MTTREQIRAILDEELMAEEQTFCGQPACPSITGKDEVVERLVKLFLIPDVIRRICDVHEDTIIDAEGKCSRCEESFDMI